MTAHQTDLPTVARTAGGDEAIAVLVERLRSLAGALHRRLPAITDGEAWVHVDGALSCLHGALIELEELEELEDDTRHRPVLSGSPTPSA
jgi:hypothetical protein